MKRLLKSLTLLALFAGMTVPAWGQASTQGTEFWVSSSLVCSPDRATPAPYIAVSAEKACTIKIQGGVGNAINITQQVAAGSWNEFGNGTTSQLNPAAGMIKVPMDPSKWYPTSMTNANNVSSLAGQKNMYGLHITATEPVSVYVILSSTHSMDASNILPMTALGSEYYTQDYWSKVKSDFNDAVGLTTILGTEDNTVIDITPNGDTFDGWQSGSTHQITLNKGQTYYLVTKKGERLAGTHIKARDKRKIAIYCGVPITNIPTAIAARDCIFEQPMPIDYWGTQFIATRSLEKNANVIGITASVDGTEINVDGASMGYINAGDTYYILLQGANLPAVKDTALSHRDAVITADAIYIETSCPTAVYSYDTGNSFKGSNAGPDEIVGGKGDPSSVWISPIQQKIGRITFGTCYTDKTKDHFLNVVTETATCQNTTLTALYGATQLDKTNLLVWNPVPGNAKYSYARAKIGDSSTAQFSVFRLENTKGFNAIIYGNGEDESYAYSAGSAAVERGVDVNGVIFSNGFRSDEKFCLNNEFTFDANVGTDQIARVDWNFGDGTSEYYGAAQTTHRYTSPGWYDVTAELYGRQICTDEAESWLGNVSFSFLVVRADTVPVDPIPVCLSLQEQKDTIRLKGQDYLDNLVKNGQRRIINEDAPCYEDKQMSLIVYNLETEETLDTIVGKDQAKGYNGKWYYAPEDVTDTLFNASGCNHYRHYYVKVLTCLELSFPNDGSRPAVCPGEELPTAYSLTKGSIRDIDAAGNNAILRVPGMPDEVFTIPNRIEPNGTLTIPTENITKPGNYTGVIVVEDEYCNMTVTLPVNFTVNYPQDIFKYKFNNVMAVYKPGYGGNAGYEFTNYEWHLNRNGQDTILAAGPEVSVLYLGEGTTFETGDQVHVVLTNKSGETLPSCAYTVREVPNYSNEANQAPAKATKKLVNRQIVIQKGDKSYNIYGQVVQ